MVNEMPFKDKEKNRIWMRSYMKRYWRKNKIAAFKILGGKCVNCGCDNIDALEINHPFGGGNEERRKAGFYERKLYRDIISGKKVDVELTCRVCNALHYLVQLKGLPNRWHITYIPEDRGVLPWAGNIGPPVLGGIPFTSQQHLFQKQQFELLNKCRIPEYNWMKKVVYPKINNLLEYRKYCASMPKSG
jgi:hypothetical protein